MRGDVTDSLPAQIACWPIVYGMRRAVPGRTIEAIIRTGIERLST